MIRDRRMAAAITAIIITVSLIANTAYSLRKERELTLSLVYEGTLIEGQSLENDIESKIGNAANLIFIAEKYIPGDKLLIFFADSRDELRNAPGLYTKYKANQKLTEASDLLYDALKNAGLSEKDMGYADSVYINLGGCNVRISYEADIYNGEARRFNRLLNAFPGFITKFLRITVPLELFEEAVN